MPIRIELQNDDGCEGVPQLEQFSGWVEAALQTSLPELEQTVRVVNEGEMQALNAQFRDLDKPTNVLAFPSDGEGLDYDYLGDLVICAPLVLTEADQQQKTPQAHWAHLTVHGMLHLQGFDHQSEHQAEQMEALEMQILDTLGYTNPYNGLS